MIQLVLRIQKIQVVSIFCLQISNLVFMKTSNFETGISDHNKMISTIMKLHFTRESPKTKYYQDYRKFDIDYFSSELSRQLNSVFCPIKENVDYEELNDFSRFHRVFLNLLNNQAPLKKFLEVAIVLL